MPGPDLPLLHRHHALRDRSLPENPRQQPAQRPLPALPGPARRLADLHRGGGQQLRGPGRLHDRQRQHHARVLRPVRPHAPGRQPDLLRPLGAGALPGPEGARRGREADQRRHGGHRLHPHRRYPDARRRPSRPPLAEPVAIRGSSVQPGGLRVRRAVPGSGAGARQPGNPRARAAPDRGRHAADLPAGGGHSCLGHRPGRPRQPQRGGDLELGTLPRPMGLTTWRTPSPCWRC